VIQGRTSFITVSISVEQWRQGIPLGFRCSYDFSMLRSASALLTDHQAEMFFFLNSPMTAPPSRNVEGPDEEGDGEAGKHDQSRWSPCAPAAPSIMSFR
jgi:hypothetical protein